MPRDLRKELIEHLTTPTFMGGQAQRIQDKLKPSNLTGSGRVQGSTDAPDAD